MIDVSVLDCTIPRFMKPRSGWPGYLESIDHGETDCLMEFGGEMNRYNIHMFESKENAREEAQSYYEDVRSGAMHQRGYVRAMQPMLDGQGYSVAVNLTDKGYRAKRCLHQNLVWCTQNEEPDPDETTRTWTKFLESQMMPDGFWFDCFENIDHPMLQEVRLNLTNIRKTIWRRVIESIKTPDHELFKRIANLPPWYADIQAEAFHRKLIIWGPKDEVR
jgi:hypothetical protein